MKIITTQAEYEEFDKRTDRGLIFIKEQGGFEKAPKKWVDAYQEMAEAMLLWEIEHNILPL